MPSDFFGLQVGLSALNVARRQMEVAAQNVSNANTEGYSRQRVEVATVGNSTVAAVHARSTGAGSGVAVVGTFRTIDEFLQARSLREHSTNAAMGRTQTVLNRLELAFNEPSESGIQAQLADFWAGWEDVANTPGSLASRSQLLQRATTLAASINQVAADMGQLWTSSVEQLQTVVVGVNATADRIAELNGSIKRAVAAGLSPNQLLDQRDRLVKDLAMQVGGEARDGELGQVNVFVGGTALVRGEDAQHLAVHVPSGSNIVTAATPANNVTLRWVKDDFAANVTGGEASALLGALNTTLPSYRAQLVGPGPSVVSINGSAVDPAALRQDFAATPATFQVRVDGGGWVNVTLDVNLETPPASAADLQTALNDALNAAGLTDLNATVATDAQGRWTTSFASDPNTATSVQVRPAVADLPANVARDLFGGTVRPGSGGSLAYQLATAVNMQHVWGVDRSEPTPQQGADFFTFDAVDGLSVALTNPAQVAAAGVGLPGLDASNGLALADLASFATGPDNTYRTLVISLGVEAQTANRRVEIQNGITQQVDAALDSAAGVSIDEEMANMVAYQHTYAAASRVITAIDQMLERLINGTGLVGR